MKQYLDLLQLVLDKGVDKGDRTGTGTRSVFGHQMRFDLAEGFPLVTTKKMFTRGMIEELLWFISGSTDVNVLQEKNVHFWDSWQREDGTIGAGYGEMLRNIHGFKDIAPRVFTRPDVEPETNLGDLSSDVDYYADLLVEWQNMLEQAETEGDFVCEEWYNFSNFYKAAKLLPGWANHLEYPDEYFLDKNALVESNCYHKEVCTWTPDEDSSINAMNPLSIKVRHIDQLKDLIADIKHTPDSRRLMISLWNPSDIAEMELPCCHGSVIQFRVTNGKLDCYTHQRSADTLLGLPVNISSYALFTMMIAQVCDLVPGDLVYSTGDTHIYNNHIDQVKEQLTRKPLALPTMKLNPEVKSIFDFKYDDFTLENYQSHASIKAKVAV